MTIQETCKKVKDNAHYIEFLSDNKKNEMLKIIADSIVENSKEILEANKVDIENTKNKQSHYIDRLTLDEKRIKDIAKGVMQVTQLKNPLGIELENYTNSNGLVIKKITVPFGVVGIIYEARPNVTVDALALAIKSGNAVILRGSSETLTTNKCIIKVIKKALEANKFQSDFIGLIEESSRESVNLLMKQKKYIDVLIPRGGAGLIQNVLENSTIPVIETGTGNCHIYVEKTCDFNMAISIILNAKTSRPSVCNACESLVVDSSIAKEFLPLLYEKLNESNVIIYGCEQSKKILPEINLATDEDFYTEFLDYKLSLKIVDNIEDAVEHINMYSSKHSESIITNDEDKAKFFQERIDSAAVYHNASTRFTDGFVFGLGAEMGISTQKTHARGPMGIKELTTYKFIIRGNGDIRI